MKPRPETPAEAWAKYREELLEPIGAGPVQLAESRLAFYAGAQTILAVLRWISGDASTEGDALRMMHAIDRDMDAFHAEVRRHAERYRAAHPEEDLA